MSSLPALLNRLRFLALLAAWALVLPFAPAAEKAADPARFEKAIAAYEAEDKTNAPPKDPTLFYGASNIRLWKSLPQRFGKQKVINRGFGGSQLSDCIHFADRVVIPYAPKTIYLNAGGNDLHAGKSPEQVLTDFKAFVAKVRAALPETKISYLSIPTSPLRWSEVEQVRKANQLIADYAKADGKVGFINFFPHLLGDDGQPRAELFVADRLHFSEAGYDIVTSCIKWQGAMDAFAGTDAKTPPGKGSIVFVGSSSIVRWKSLAQDFPEHKVVNRGFGGSEMFDSVNYFDRAVLPHQPRLIVLYAGGNDINAGKTPERVEADFKNFVALVKQKLPGTRIAYISVAGNPARWKQVDTVREANRRIEAITKSDPKLAFINVFAAMLGADDLPKPDIFVEDKLHMNEKGYAIWKEVVGPFLK
ncbi:MAG: GDSL-type esterase/lipase family protein [Limisphaerales bacterium]